MTDAELALLDAAENRIKLIEMADEIRNLKAELAKYRHGSIAE